jgi:hypothetical protein
MWCYHSLSGQCLPRMTCRCVRAQCSSPALRSLAPTIDISPAAGLNTGQIFILWILDKNRVIKKCSQGGAQMIRSSNGDTGTEVKYHTTRSREQIYLNMARRHQTSLGKQDGWATFIDVTNTPIKQTIIATVFWWQSVLGHRGSHHTLGTGRH